MNKTTLMQKLAGSRPSLESRVQHWGLPKEHLFPLDTANLVKTAAERFDTQMEQMTPAQRLVCARNICARAEDEGLDVGSSRAHKYASAGLSPHFRQWLNMRKEATAHLFDSELDKLAEVADVFASKPDVKIRVAGLDKVAAALEDFDSRHKLQGHWGSWMPDPAYTVYGPVENMDQDMERTVKVASFELRASDLESADWDQLNGKLEPEIIDGLRDADDKLAVFASLPMPHKEIITQSLMAE